MEALDGAAGTGIVSTGSSVGGRLCVTVGQGEDGMTARGVLRRAKGVSQRLIRKIIHGEGDGAGALYVNGSLARFDGRVRAGDELTLIFPEEESWIEPENISLSILYEDGDILVINKAPGMIVHPTKGHRSGTLANAIVFHMRRSGENYKPRFISRLDMDTSGILLVGKNSHAQDNLTRQSACGRVDKVYTAILSGRLEDDMPQSGLIDLPIGLAAPGEPRRTVLPEEDGGYPSQTAYEILRALQTEGIDNRNCFESALSLVRARLITGRTHQIRVHFAHYGHPVLGDRLYGSPSPMINRQALHASSLEFDHPANGRRMRFDASLPEDMLVILP